MEQPIIEVPASVALDHETDAYPPTNRRIPKIICIFLLIAVGLCTPLLLAGSYMYITNLPSPDFNATSITIASGTSVWNIAQQLEAENIVRSDLMLFLTLRYLEDPTQIKASTYTFDEPLSSRTVARTLITGQFDNELVRITFIEGTRVTDFATVAATLPEITKNEFLALTDNL